MSTAPESKAACAHGAREHFGPLILCCSQSERMGVVQDPCHVAQGCSILCAAPGEVLILSEAAHDHMSRVKEGKTPEQDPVSARSHNAWSS